jgi:hypothetical protein
VLHLQGALYHGAECMHRLALLSTRSSLLNRINARIFSHAATARLLYPWLRAGRNAVLMALGRTKIGVAK